MLCELNADYKTRASEKSWRYELPLTKHLLEWGLAYIFNDPQSMPCLASHAQAYPMPLFLALSWPRVGLSPLTTGTHGLETKELRGDILHTGPEHGTEKRGGVF